MRIQRTTRNISWFGERGDSKTYLVLKKKWISGCLMLLCWNRWPLCLAMLNAWRKPAQWCLEPCKSRSTIGDPWWKQSNEEAAQVGFDDSRGFQMLSKWSKSQGLLEGFEGLLRKISNAKMQEWESEEIWSREAVILLVSRVAKCQKWT